MLEKRLHSRHIVACLWDFDKTLIPGYMQRSLFEEYGIDEELFWKEVNALPAIYAERGVWVAGESVYLNHLLSFVKNGPMKGLNNGRLRELGRRLQFYPGLPELFPKLKVMVFEHPEYRRHDIQLEHYIISTGLAEMIRGTEIAAHVDGIFGCEFVENALPPYFSRQQELSFSMEPEISQIGMIVDNTIKTRFVFEINKGSNRNPAIDVNAKMAPEDRRIPVQNMIYVADGPSDVPVFSVIRKGGGKTFAVYDPASQAEFEQNDQLLQDGRVHGYGPADYTGTSQTTRWLRLQISQICDRLVSETQQAVARRVKRPPRHIHPEMETVQEGPATEQEELFANDDAFGMD